MCAVLLALAAALAVPAGAAAPAARTADGLPAAVDWRANLAVTPAKRTGQCDDLASQAHATAAALEGAWVVQNHHLLTAFTPQITDTAGDDVYDQVCGEPRGLGATFPAGAFKQWEPVASGDEEALKAAVAQGPVRARIDASHGSFQVYTVGVYDEPLCSSSSPDHYVTIVGYGTTPAGEDYWTVKNDYGTLWGTLGFVQMSRNQGNQCGIATQADRPVLNPAPYTAPSQNPWPNFP